MSTVAMAFTGLHRHLHARGDIFSLDDLYLAGKTPLLVGDMPINFARNKHISGKSHLTWLTRDSPYLDIALYSGQEWVTDWTYTVLALII